MNKISTFAPDANPLTTGIAVSVDNAYPSENGGMRAMPSIKAFAPALNSTCLGCFAYQDLDNSFRTIAGTASALYQLDSLSWSDVSGTVYAATKWRFAAWGNYILATNAIDLMQVQTTSGGAFSDVAAAPKAKYINVSNDFVIVANVYPSNSNRIQWCSQGDYTDWTPSLSTQSGYMDLGDTPGAITGIARLRDNIIVFKERSMYLGTYIGPPYVWNFQVIQTHSGAFDQESIVELENGIYYVGTDDFYVYDGTSPVGLGAGLRYWFFNNVDRGYQANIQGVYDGMKKLILWFYPTVADGTGNPLEAVIYDYKNKRWGHISQPIETVLVHWGAGITYDTLANFFATYTILEAEAPYYDSPWWSAKSFGLAAIGINHKLGRFNGTPGVAQIITGDGGSLRGFSRTLKAYPYFNIAPQTVTMGDYFETDYFADDYFYYTPDIQPTISSRTKYTLGGAVTTGTAQLLKSDGSVDLDCTGRFTSLQFDMSGDWEIVGFETDTTQASIN